MRIKPFGVLEAACTLVERLPDEVGAQLEAAYALDRAGFEHRALQHYEVAHRLGVPLSERRHFTVGYGSTLRNVGKHEEAVAVFAQAAASDPEYPAYAAFLALALDSAGQPRAALATMLGCALDVAHPNAFDGYERALSEYRRVLSRDAG
jgi:tetratricopeptide (TPR) repeat protein